MCPYPWYITNWHVLVDIVLLPSKQQLLLLQGWQPDWHLFIQQSSHSVDLSKTFLEANKPHNFFGPLTTNPPVSCFIELWPGPPLSVSHFLLPCETTAGEKTVNLAKVYALRWENTSCENASEGMIRNAFLFSYIISRPSAHFRNVNRWLESNALK